MTDENRKCVCGHTRSAHDVGYGCTIGGEVVGGDREDCECSWFRPAEEAKSSTESVYDRARQALWRIERGDYGHDDDKTILAALKAGEAAEKRSEVAEKRLSAVEQKKDEYLIGMVRISEWIAEEHEKYKRQARGGQMVGDSHSPRIALSLLIELDRMIRIDDLRYTRERMIEVVNRAETAERERDALKARVAALETAYLFEKERRIAAESKLK